MHPAYSVIFFTVASGAGLGLLAFMGLGAASAGEQPTSFLLVTFGIAFALTVGGLLSSTLHLGHPERAWRAMTQWRSSWLSREGVLAVISLIVAAIFAGLWIFFNLSSAILGIITAFLALVTVWATGMIYAQIKAVDLWHRWLTPVCYLLFSIAGGTVLFLFLHALFADKATWELSSITMIALLIAWAVKLFWWKGGDTAPTSTPGTATGLGHLGEVRLLERPHTGSNYLLKEMGHQIARKHVRKLRLIAVILGAVIPILLILLAIPAPLDALWLGLAVVAHLTGMLVERWLFFAEARHAVMSYY